MYYYLSFLRPPPTSSIPTGTITITPQITNDLRTEFFQETVDILYSWTLEGSNSQRTAPAKLTTWKGSSSAYKGVPLPLPHLARPPQRWRLTLFCAPHASLSIPLGRLYPQPFGSSSLPISIVSPKRVLETIPKQDEIERTLALPAIKTEGGASSLIVRERTSYDLDKKVWDSGIALAGWLCKTIGGNAPSEGGRLLRTAINAPGSCHVIELGAGTGLVSLAFAALTAGRRGLSVTITDLASAIPLLEHNIHQNQQYFEGTNVASAVLDWEEDLPGHITSAGPFQLIFMSDVTYNPASFPSLLNTLVALRGLSQDTGTETLAVLAYKERDTGERDLWAMMEQADIKFVKLDEISGHGGKPVELWFAHFPSGVLEDGVD